MNLHITRTFNALCIALFGALCMMSCEKQVINERDFEIIYTTDIHGAMLNVDFLRKQKQVVSMANMMSYVRQARDKDQEVILLDGGDILQGDPSMYYYNVEAIREQHLATRVYNYVKYDAITLGNHDFECGESVYYDHIFKQSEASILAANAIDTRTGEPMFKPYTIIERSGFKVAVLGLTNPFVPMWLSKAMYPHLRFESMTESTQRWVDKIREQENPDMLVAIFHAGHEHPDFTDENGNVYVDGVAEVIAQTRGIDLVLIGHDHKWDNKKLLNADGDSIQMIEPKSHAEQLASVKFTLVRNEEKGHADIKFREAILENSWQMDPDPEYNEFFASEIGTINDYLDTPLGVIADTLHGRESLTGQTNLMDFIHEVQLNKTGADISLASAMSSFGDIPAGEITMRQLFELYKYENQLSKMWMTGREIQKFLDWGYSRQFSLMSSRQGHLLNYIIDPTTKEVVMGNFGPELVTPQYNFTSAAGINYTVDVSKPAGKRVFIDSLSDGTPFDLDRRYIVVLTSYQASGGGGFIRKGLGWTDDDIRYHSVTESVKDMRYFIAQHIRLNGTIKPKPIGSWRVTPVEWWLANKERDIDLLLPYLKH